MESILPLVPGDPDLFQKLVGGENYHTLMVVHVLNLYI